MDNKYCVYYIRFDMRGAYEDGKTEHPQVELKKLQEQLGFNVLYSEPVSIADCWLFLIESDDAWLTKKFPSWIDVLGLPREKNNREFKKLIFGSK